MEKIKKNFLQNKTLYIMVGTSIISTSISLSVYLYAQTIPEQAITVSNDSAIDEDVSPEEDMIGAEIYVDVSGAVVNPGMYALSSDSRVSDAVQEAGGLSKKADIDYFYRSYNIARILVDQDKIYIPREDETSTGIFIEDAYTIDHSLQRVEESKQNVHTDIDYSSDKVSVNNASQDELETLDRIGPVTAQKIIDNRPYTSIDELVERDVVSQSVFDGIASDIGL